MSEFPPTSTRTIKRALKLALLFGIVGAMSTIVDANSLGRDYEEDSEEDAGNTPDTAQKVIVDTSTVVLLVRGELKGEAEGVAGEPGDFQDMYELVIREPGEFAVQTTPPLGGAEFNTILSVYDAQGQPMLANDDAFEGTTGSRIGNSSTSGSVIIDQPGVFYLAISGFNSRPLDAESNNLFAWTDNPTDVVGPNPQSGPLTQWSAPGEIGEYAIRVTGVGPIPSGCGAPNTSSCFLVHPLPFCSTPECCEAVCTVDPHCCEVTWDANCVGQAEFFCNNEEFLGCGNPDNGSCYQANETPYCEDPACCALVCSAQPECCNISWDATCSKAATALCEPQPCNPDCPGDLSLDGEVNGADLTILLGNWNQPGCSDLDFNGTTDGGDLAILLGFWGSCKN